MVTVITIGMGLINASALIDDNPVNTARPLTPSELNTGDPSEIDNSSPLPRIHARASKTLTVTHYYQDGGQTWSNDKLGTSSWDSTDTIGTHGCLVTSVSMVQRYLKGMYNPRGVNNQLKSAGLNTDDLSLDGVATAFGYTTKLKVYHEKTADATAISKIKTEIDAGRPVIIGLAKFNGTTVTATHFVVAYGYNNDTIYINDPLKANDYTELSTYLNSWWVYNLRSYSN